ncbi:hypothetical protein Bhyg_12590 [Pseudolycoriella hygida]|uniref:Uncharacterized protein n=1 Tax=Pseudolycoriella hygida TaxID=35572 RepID=A0A9Q0S1E4_9DIPT|nr:hypothetical protein Bhyg_12590 [Pseudolycoriella hygida]
MANTKNDSLAGAWLAGVYPQQFRRTASVQQIQIYSVPQLCDDAKRRIKVASKKTEKRSQSLKTFSYIFAGITKIFRLQVEMLNDEILRSSQLLGLALKPTSVQSVLKRRPSNETSIEHSRICKQSRMEVDWKSFESIENLHIDIESTIQILRNDYVMNNDEISIAEIIESPEEEANDSDYFDAVDNVTTDYFLEIQELVAQGRSLLHLIEHEESGFSVTRKSGPLDEGRYASIMQQECTSLSNKSDDDIPCDDGPSDIAPVHVDEPVSTLTLSSVQDFRENCNVMDEEDDETYRLMQGVNLHVDMTKLTFLDLGIWYNYSDFTNSAQDFVYDFRAATNLRHLAVNGGMIENIWVETTRLTSLKVSNMIHTYRLRGKYHNFVPQGMTAFLTSFPNLKDLNTSYFLPNEIVSPLKARMRTFDGTIENGFCEMIEEDEEDDGITLMETDYHDEGVCAESFPIDSNFSISCNRDEDTIGEEVDVPNLPSVNNCLTMEPQCNYVSVDPIVDPQPIGKCIRPDSATVPRNVMQLLRKFITDQEETSHGGSQIGNQLKATENRKKFGLQEVLEKLFVLWNSGSHPIGMKDLMNTCKDKVAAASAFYAILELNSPRINLIQIEKCENSKMIYNIAMSEKLIGLLQKNIN